jgi:hypothetical protein
MLLPTRTLHRFIVIGLVSAFIALGLAQAKVTIASTSSLRVAQAESKELATLSFDPILDGYRFTNYADSSTSDRQPFDPYYNAELPSSYLVTLFGSEVCQNKVTDVIGNCVALTAAAAKWRQEQFNTLQAGRAEGMVTSSLVLWLAKQNNLQAEVGIYAPNRLPDGSAANLSGIPERNIWVRRSILFYNLMQRLDPVVAAASQSRLSMPPSQMARKLVEGLKTKTLYTIGLYNTVDGQLIDGHAIAPFAVAQTSDGGYRISVYDSNLPGKASYLDIKADDTWSYQTIVDQTPKVYRGSSATKTLELVPLQARSVPTGKFPCPFCQTSGSVEFSLTGEGSMTIAQYTNYAKRQVTQIGYDSHTKQNFSAPNAQTAPYKGGLSKATAPTYRLSDFATLGQPYDPEIKQLYDIGIHGNTAKPTSTISNLTMAGAGYVLGVDGLVMNSVEGLTLRFVPDEKTLLFRAAQDTTIASIFYGVDGVDGSYLFEVKDLMLKPGDLRGVRLDPDQKQLAYFNQDGATGSYTLRVTRIAKNGTTNVYTTPNQATLEKGKTALLSYGALSEAGQLNVSYEPYKDDANAQDVPIQRRGRNADRPQ